LVGRLDRRQWRHGGEGGDFRRRCSGRRHAGRAERWVAIEGGIRIDRLLRISSVASAPPLRRPNCPWSRQPVPNSTIESHSHHCRWGRKNPSSIRSAGVEVSGLAPCSYLCPYPVLFRIGSDATCFSLKFCDSLHGRFDAFFGRFNWFRDVTDVD
jgi:hypothetical protein